VVTDNQRQIELAKATLEVISGRGENMADIRHGIHYFYGGNFVALGASLAELGYSVRPTVNNDGIVAERHEAIGEEWRTTSLSNLCELADTYGVEYDGWEASMNKQPSKAANAYGSQRAGLLSKIFGKKT